MDRVICEVGWHGVVRVNVSKVMTRLWSPVTVVTSNFEGRVNGQVAVSISAASIVPDLPRVLVQIYKTNFSHGLISDSGVCTVNFLSPDQVEMIPVFGFVSGNEINKFDGIIYETGVTGCPILADTWGHFDIKIIDSMDAGDMTCFLGSVVAGIVDDSKAPLYWNQARRTLSPEQNDHWDELVRSQISISEKAMKF